MHPALSADWKLVDGTLRGLSLAQAEIDSEIGHWLLAATRTKPWEKCGMRSLYEYFERIFGWAPQTISERLRTATELAKLPALDAELESGRLNFSAVRELTRVANAGTEQEWIDYARGKTARQIEEKVARHVKGERPRDRGDLSRVTKRMVVPFTADQYAVVTAAIAMMRKHDPTLTEAECIRMMAATAMAAMNAPDTLTPTTTPRPPVRLQVEVGLDGTSFLKGIGEERSEVSPALVECAECDAEIWIRRPDGSLEKIRTAIPQRMKRLLMERCKGRCELCKIRIEPHGHHLWLVSEGGKHDLENLIALCPSHHTRVHDGALWIQGTASTGFTFTMADGAPYGSGAPSPIAAHHIEVFQGLRGLGFKEKEIRPVLETFRDRDLPIAVLLRDVIKAIHQRSELEAKSNAAAKSPTWEKFAKSAPAPANSPTWEKEAPPAPIAAKSPTWENAAGATADPQSDAAEALRGLGFTEGEMKPVLLALRSRDLPLPELIRQSLQMLHAQRNGSPAPRVESAPHEVARSPESPTWETSRPAVRKYILRPPESDGVAERAATYIIPVSAPRHRAASPHLRPKSLATSAWEISTAW